MDQVQERLRESWLNLVQAAAGAKGQSRDVLDDWSFVVSVLTDARGALELCSEAGFSPVRGDEVPAGSCAELIRAGIAAMQAIPRELEPPQVVVAFLAATDALHLVHRQAVA